MHTVQTYRSVFELLIYPNPTTAALFEISAVSAILLYVRAPTPHYSAVAQLVERLAVNEDVAGSSPAAGAKKKESHRWLFFLEFTIQQVL